LFLARIRCRITATEKHTAYQGRHVYVVQPVNPDESPAGDEWVAVDTVGANTGDLVVCGGAPGVAQTVFGLERAPIRTLIVAIVDNVDYREPESRGEPGPATAGRTGGSVRKP
jgi:ethanolamine utilization protein EutN